MSALEKEAMKLSRLTSQEYALECTAAFKERDDHPDEWSAFCHPDWIEKTIAVFKFSIERVRAQLDAHAEGVLDQDARWAVRARQAKRSYETELGELVRMHARHRAEGRRARHEAGDNRRIALLLDCVEELAIMLENRDELPADMLLPTISDDPITISAWLDAREDRRRARGGA